MPRPKRDDIDRFFDHGLDLSNRTVYVGSVYSDEDGESGVDSNLSEKTIKALSTLDLSAPDGDKPITVILNSLGGDWYHGLAIFDAIMVCKNRVIVKVFGYAMSMGSIIMQAADVRLMAPNAKMMIHHGFDGMSMDHPKKLQSMARESKRIRDHMLDVYLVQIRRKHPNFSRAKLDKMCDFDTFLSSQEAVELGLADGIIGTGDGFGQET